MSGLGDLLGFEAFNLKEIGRKIKKDPERLLIGAVDPASSKVWSKALGKDYEPMLDQWGGASADTYRKAEDAGINTKTAHNMHRAARVVAAYFASAYGAGAAGLGGAAAGGGSGGSGLAGLGSNIGAELGASMGSGAGAGLGLGGGAGAGYAGAGAGGAGAGAGAANAGAGYGLGGASSFSLRDLQRMQSQSPKQEEVHLEDVEYEPPDMEAYLATTVPSSRELKTPRRGLGDALQRGIRSEDPIDSNGVEVAAIQELDRRMEAVLARIQKLKGARR